MSASGLPRHARGPAPNAENSNGLGSAARPTKRSGSNASGSAYRRASRPIAYGEKMIIAPAGTTVPSGSTSARFAKRTDLGTLVEAQHLERDGVRVFQPGDGVVRDRRAHVETAVRVGRDGARELGAQPRLHAGRAGELRRHRPRERARGRVAPAQQERDGEVAQLAIARARARLGRRARAAARRARGLDAGVGDEPREQVRPERRRLVDAARAPRADHARGERVDDARARRDGALGARDAERAARAHAGLRRRLPP